MTKQTKEGKRSKKRQRKGPKGGDQPKPLPEGREEHRPRREDFDPATHPTYRDCSAEAGDPLVNGRPIVDAGDAHSSLARWDEDMDVL